MYYDACIACREEVGENEEYEVEYELYTVRVGDAYATHSNVWAPICYLLFRKFNLLSVFSCLINNQTSFEF